MCLTEQSSCLLAAVFVDQAAQDIENKVIPELQPFRLHDHLTQRQMLEWCKLRICVYVHFCEQRGAVDQKAYQEMSQTVMAELYRRFNIRIEEYLSLMILVPNLLANDKVCSTIRRPLQSLLLYWYLFHIAKNVPDAVADELLEEKSLAQINVEIARRGNRCRLPENDAPWNQYCQAMEGALTGVLKGIDFLHRKQ